MKLYKEMTRKEFASKKKDLEQAIDALQKLTDLIREEYEAMEEAYKAVAPWESERRLRQ